MFCIATCLVLVLVLVGATLFKKKPKAPEFQIGLGLNLAGMFFK